MLRIPKRPKKPVADKPKGEAEPETTPGQEPAKKTQQGKKAPGSLADEFQKMLDERDRGGPAEQAEQGGAKPDAKQPTDPATGAKPQAKEPVKKQTTEAAAGEPAKETTPDKDADAKAVPEKDAAGAEEPKVTTEEPKVTLEEPKVTAEEPKVTSEEPKVTTEEPKQDVTPPAKPATDEAGKTDASQAEGTESSGGEPEIGEGPEELAQKFEKILAELRAKGTLDESTAPDTKIEPKKEVVAPPKKEVEPPPVNVDEEPTIGVVVLRVADDLGDVSPTERIGQLILSGEQFTNRTLRDLAGLSVESLSIEAVNVSNAGIQYVGEVRGVRQLRLWSPGIDDDALKLIAELGQLEVLDIEGTAIGGADFIALQNLPQLESLVLGPKVTDESVANLGQLAALRQLDLRACGRLTLDCLDSLAKLTDLEVIWLPQHLRTKGKRALRLTLPDCQVRS